LTKALELDPIMVEKNGIPKPVQVDAQMPRNRKRMSVQLAYLHSLKIETFLIFDF
jgi:hypothetical protein